MLVLSRRNHEAVMIDDQVKIIVLEINGQHVKLGFEAPKNIEIHREEIFAKIQQQKLNGNPSQEEN